MGGDVRRGSHRGRYRGGGGRSASPCQVHQVYHGCCVLALALPAPTQTKRKYNKYSCRHRPYTRTRTHAQQTSARRSQCALDTARIRNFRRPVSAGLSFYQRLHHTPQQRQQQWQRLQRRRQGDIRDFTLHVSSTEFRVCFGGVSIFMCCIRASARENRWLTKFPSRNNPIPLYFWHAATLLPFRLLSSTTFLVAPFLCRYVGAFGNNLADALGVYKEPCCSSQVTNACMSNLPSILVLPSTFLPYRPHSIFVRMYMCAVSVCAYVR